MPTNLNLDDALLHEAVKLFGAVRFFGKLEWDPRFDYKKERDRR